eukprot:CAMPEP_0117435914 /NCGR_PEP_ID=MMETSP0759-20121206/733_1 /TAXON_ID=63605 /ORGANISM="Percolomonas cosmopolitus, Strain WS" /LENGTH=780 /DNA_ID=CAMNT_0005227489 /DNA_START=522 /DNA_END=2864 /DNA_ORIENTATION=+
MDNTKFLTSCHVRNIEKLPVIGLVEQIAPSNASLSSTSAKNKSSNSLHGTDDDKKSTPSRKKSHHSLRSLKSNATSAANQLDLAEIERHVMVFACTDTRNHLFQKMVNVEELFEIRESLDVNMTVGWWHFFRALKHCFLNHRVHLDFRPSEGSGIGGAGGDGAVGTTNRNDADGGTSGGASSGAPTLSRQVSNSSISSLNSTSQDMCNMTLELHLPTLGRTSLTLKLQRVEDTTKHLTQYFLEPLYEFFGQPGDYDTAEKLERLEKQVKLYREKIHIIKERMHQEEQLGGLHSTTTNTTMKKQRSQMSIQSTGSGGKTLNPPMVVTNTDGEEELVVLPTGNIMNLLRDMQSKLIEQNALTETEKMAFSSVVELLSQDSMYSTEFNQNAQREVDKEIITWLKMRFGVDNAQPDSTKDSPSAGQQLKNTLNLRNAADFLQSSNQINRSTTRQSIMSMFNKVDDWNFDVFTLEELTEGQTLFITAYTLFTKYDLLNKFRIDEKTLVNFLREIESGYHPNPYHNSMHAADVLQVLHCIIYRGELGKSMNDEDIFAALLSAIIHDYDHPGLNNAFQVNSQSYLATLYNDRSVLENHHCAQAFELMKSSQYNILANLTPEQRRDVRETMIQMVLSTDMSQHVKYISKFKQRVEARADFSSKEDLRLALQVAVKMADVSNPSRPQHLYLKWSERLCDEFYRQGDKEREIKVPISPLMDREKPSLAKGQIAFINYIISPMLESFCELFPSMKFAVKYVNGNRAYWEKNQDFPSQQGGEEGRSGEEGME